MGARVGAIVSASADSSEINIDWGAFEGVTSLCVIEEDPFDCFGEEHCLEIGVKRSVNITEYSDQLFVVYPNPFRDETTIKFTNPTNSIAKITLMDLRGRIVRQYEGINNNQLIIKRSELTSGLYYLDLEMDNNRFRNTIVIE